MTFRDLIERVYREGRCVNAPSQDPWFDSDARGVQARQRQRQRAREVCADCLVRGECLAVALAFEAQMGESWGIWGGVCARDRQDVILAVTGHESASTADSDGSCYADRRGISTGLPERLLHPHENSSHTSD